MPRFLAIDVGAGTLDALYVDTATGDQFKFVGKSPTRVLAERIAACERDRILITGRQMGGGPVAEAIRIKAGEARVMMTRSAAETIHHHLGRIKKSGVHLVSQGTARLEAGKRNVAWFKTGDVRPEFIGATLNSMGIEAAVDFLGVAVQDHGTPKKGISSLDFRHQIFREIIERSPRPSAFLFEAREIPPFLRRMHAAAKDSSRIRARRTYLMDTGMAAVLGASKDPLALGKANVIVLDVATSHTLGALLVEEEIMGFFEYHTRDLSPEILKSLIVDLAEGRLSHERVVSGGGHGAYVRGGVGFDRVELIVATGPKRGVVDRMGLDRMVLGA
ncbi:MAG: pyruvate formate-lyase activating enzyme, partial [Deltaproteobacteria bacterium]|nr:pyruvate formate-lyase activating enzyme [Deltaproteobacteria bacterium]